MNDTTVQTNVATQNLASDIPSMVLPVDGKGFLLPGVAVAEIIPFSQPSRSGDEPTWFMGVITWRKLQVPVVSFGELNGQQPVTSPARKHIAVLNNTGVNEGLPFIAILIQGIPRLIRVTPKDITNDHETTTSPMELMAVKLAGDTFFVPNVSALENACLTYFSPE
jgi:chemosensory pili system protein ChpC